MSATRRSSVLCLLSLAALQACDAEPALPRPKEKLDESHPGTLVITSPARAAFLEADASGVVVRGTGASSALKINGAPVTVAPDGSFETTIRPEVGLNVVVATDNNSRLETPFLYGHFVSPRTLVEQAISLELGSAGINGSAPAASLMTVANEALRSRDLIGAMVGRQFTGEAMGVAWTYDVTGGHNGAITVDLGSFSKGLSTRAFLDDVVVEGMLTIQVLGISTSRFTRMVVERATVAGDTSFAINDGMLSATMPSAFAELEGFAFDTDNLGFPCCVDDVVSKLLRPKIESSIAEGIRTELPKSVQFTLDGMGLPKELDLSSVGLAHSIPISTRFDSGTFDLWGARVTSSVRFGGDFAPGSIGAKVPGWLKLGVPLADPPRVSSLGVSFSVDAINQLLFAAWGTGDLSLSVPTARLKLSPALPPVLSITSQGAVRVGIGEVVVQETQSTSPMAAVTIMQDIVPAADGDAFFLSPKGEPTISITWLADGSEAAGKNVIASAAKDEVARLLKPVRIPLPRVRLAALSEGLADKTLGVESLSLTVDAKAARLLAAGSMTLR